MRRTPFLVAAALAAVVTVSLALAPAATAAPPPLTPVPRLDLARYVGGWYQLAAVPAIYEAQCDRNSRAFYTARPDGTVAVRNTCRTWWGSTSAVDGTARVDNAPRNSALTVSFFSFGGAPVYGDRPNYLVFGLDPRYRWALVGDPDRVSGFVLSRTPTLPPAVQHTIRVAITANGYDPCRFRYTVQDGGTSERGPIC